MLRDLTSQKKIDPQVIVAAIESLRAKGWDVNPNTVADEAKVPRSSVYRSPELMELVNQARSGIEPTVQESASRVLELERLTAELEEQIAALQSENQTLSRGRQDAWQEGYDAGLKEGRALAASEATRVETSPQFYAAPQDVTGVEDKGEPEPQNESESTDVEVEPVVADLPPTAEPEVYVSEEWLKNHQPEPEPEPVSAVAAADYEDAEDAPVNALSSSSGYVDAQAVVDETIYAEEPYYPEESLQETSTAQNDQGAYSYSESDAPEQDSPAYFQQAYEYGQSGDEGVELGFAEEEWRAGLEESDVNYSGADAYTYSSSGEPESAVDDPSKTQINEDELRDLLKYRFGRSSQEQIPEVEPEKKLAGSKFVGGARPTQEVPKHNFVVRQVPPDIRKACLVLGLRPEELTRETVHKAWKKEMANPGTHPDVGGDTEIAVYINTAKDTLMRWVDSQAPKLGKQFGKSGRDPSKPDEKASTEKAGEQRGQPEPQ